MTHGAGERRAPAWARHPNCPGAIKGWKISRADPQTTTKHAESNYDRNAKAGEKSWSGSAGLRCHFQFTQEFVRQTASTCH